MAGPYVADQGPSFVLDFDGAVYLLTYLLTEHCYVWAWLWRSLMSLMSTLR